jgi:hypothetical protein
MADFVLAFLGIVGGLLAIGGALYFAVRPEFRPKPRRSWLAKPSGEPHTPGIATMGSSGDWSGPGHNGG